VSYYLIVTTSYGSVWRARRLRSHITGDTTITSIEPYDRIRSGGNIHQHHRLDFSATRPDDNTQVNFSTTGIPPSSFLQLTSCQLVDFNHGDHALISQDSTYYVTATTFPVGGPAPRTQMPYHVRAFHTCCGQRQPHSAGSQSVTITGTDSSATHPVPRPRPADSNVRKLRHVERDQTSPVASPQPLTATIPTGGHAGQTIT